jgi:hypothetical protein
MISKVPGLVQVLKFLMEKNSTNALHGQVTIGTLILQVEVLFTHSSILSFVCCVSLSLSGTQLIHVNFPSTTCIFGLFYLSGLCSWFAVCTASCFRWNFWRSSRTNVHD